MDKKTEKQIEKELRGQTKFSLGGAIGRAGKGLMKGASPISPQEQASKTLQEWINVNTPDPSGALKEILRRRIRTTVYPDAIDPQHPYPVLSKLVDAILANDYQLKEFVRQVDIRWGEIYQERPHFEKEGQPPHPDDEYTIASVRETLTELSTKLAML